MTKRTEREFHIALGKLLDRVRVQNSWSEQSFVSAAKHVANVIPSEALRFYKALVEMNLLTPGSNRRKLAPNFDTNIYRNTDKMIGFVKDILETNPNIVQKKGRKLGMKCPKKQEEIVYPVMCTDVEVIEEMINPLTQFTPQDLVQELRNRGYKVTATRQVVVTEEL